MQIYVKPNSNCQGLPLTTFQPLGVAFVADSLDIYCGDDEDRQLCQVEGFSSLYGGSATRAHIQHVRANDGSTGYLVWGADYGLRITPPDGEPWGTPILWIAESDIHQDLGPDTHSGLFQIETTQP
jgi:hypothetical protein